MMILLNPANKISGDLTKRGQMAKGGGERRVVVVCSSLESMYYVWMNHRSKKPSNNAALRGLLVFWPLWNECMAFLERTETARGQSSFSLFFSDFITTIRGTWCVRGCVCFVCSFSFSSSFSFDVKKMLKSFFFSFLVGFRFLKLGLSSHWD